jgi:hypothetical protein
MDNEYHALFLVAIGVWAMILWPAILLALIDKYLI